MTQLIGFIVQWWRDLFRCRIDLLNFSMGFNIVAPYSTPELVYQWWSSPHKACPLCVVTDIINITEPSPHIDICSSKVSCKTKKKNQPLMAIHSPYFCTEGGTQGFFFIVFAPYLCPDLKQFKANISLLYIFQFNNLTAAYKTKNILSYDHLLMFFFVSFIGNQLLPFAHTFFVIWIEIKFSDNISS